MVRKGAPSRRRVLSPRPGAPPSRLRDLAWPGRFALRLAGPPPSSVRSPEAPVEIPHTTRRRERPSPFFAGTAAAGAAVPYVEPMPTPRTRSSTAPRSPRSPRRAGRRARLSGARAHRPRWRLRVARVRACRAVLRRPGDHGRRGDASRRPPRHAPRRESVRLLEPLPVDHGGARRDPAEGERDPSTRARSDTPPRAQRGPRLPVRLRAPRACRRRPERGRRARSIVRRDRFYVELQRLYSAATPECSPSRPRRGARRPHRRHRRPARPPPGAGTAPGRARRDSQPHLGSTAASPSGAATTRASSSRPPRCSSAFPTTATLSGARSRSPNGWSST